MLTENELENWRLKMRVEALENLILTMAHLQAQYVEGSAESLAARCGQLRMLVQHSGVPGVPAEYSDLMMSEYLDILDSIFSRLPRVAPSGS